MQATEARKGLFLLKNVKNAILRPARGWNLVKKCNFKPLPALQA
jgi:hypothetical protein